MKENVLALVLGSVGLAIVMAAAAHTPQPFAAPLGVEAGFTVMVIGFLLARAELGYRAALRIMVPLAVAQLGVIWFQRVSLAWIGAELAVAGVVGLVPVNRPSRAH